jgi:hypothetical protein
MLFEKGKPIGRKHTFWPMGAIVVILKKMEGQIKMWEQA